MNRRPFDRPTVALLALGAAGLVVFLNFRDQAFPTASVGLEVGREEAGERAEAFLQSRGYNTEDYRDALVFRVDDAAAVYLQRVLGMPEANRFIREEFPLWYWEGRWFRSAEKEELRARIGPRGELIGFRHLIEEARAGADLPPDSARALAEVFLSAVVGLNLEQYEEVEASSQKQENRTDHHLEWEREQYELPWTPDDPEAGVGTLRVSATVQGDQVGGFSRFYKVPEKFVRLQARQESRGQLLTLISLFFMLVLLILALIVVVRKYKVDQIRWGMPMAFGAAVLFLLIFQQITSFPVLKMRYPTELEFGIFVAVMLVVVIIVALLQAIMVVASAAGGEALAREVFPESTRGLGELARGRFLHPAFAPAALRGYALAFAFLGYVAVFYLVGRRHLGVWIPAESPHSEILSYHLPWLTPLALSFLAAVSEEFVFRLFSISLLKKWLRATFPALLIPAVVWAFAHSSYPVFPVYIRGIELTVAGVAFGWVFIRYGLLTTLIAHYVIDAVFFSLPLLGSENSYLVTSGYVVIGLAALPGVLGLIAAARHSEAVGLLDKGRS